MKKRVWGLLALASVVLVGTNLAPAATKVQQQGTDYLIFEAEDFDSDDLNDPDNGFLVISPDDPQEIILHNSNPGTIMVPPPSSNPSGRLAILDQEGGSDFTDVLTYTLQFETAGDYYLYMRYSLFDLRGLIDNTYGNEDSIYLPVYSLDEDPTSDELRASREGFVAFSSNVDGQQTLPFDGCRIPEEPWVVPDDECDAEGLRGATQFEGQYHWQRSQFNTLGTPVLYSVGDVGLAVDFNIASRERGTSIDVFVFSQNPDLTSEELDDMIGLGGGGPGVEGDFNGDGALDTGDIDTLTVQAAGGANPPIFDLNKDSRVDASDINYWIHDLKHTWIGDANLDDQFNSGDLVVLFSAGTYETGASAVWTTGDFNGDGMFSTTDLVAALSDGGYEAGLRASVAAVPEPGGFVLASLAGVGLLRRRRTH
ncbi:MAG: hypothetical protein KDA92_09565 [Planctomycetales bacterium]|nr:hypothetical protein [Planctomycetales bacterium]